MAIAALAAGTTVRAQDWVKLDVPYVQTPPGVMKAMLDAANIGPNDVVYDLGSGDGRIVIAAVRERGASRGVGIDLNPKRIAEATTNAAAAGVSDRVRFIQGDVFAAEFSQASVVTMYLLNNVNLRLRPRLLDELKPGTRVVSHQFHMYDWQPDDLRMVGGTIPVYLWIIPAKVAGIWRGTLGDESVRIVLRQTFQMIEGELSLGSRAPSAVRGRANGALITFTADASAGDVVSFTGTMEAAALAGTIRHDGKQTALTLRQE
jgi:SAM-dependent methyltransferase